MRQRKHPQTNLCIFLHRMPGKMRKGVQNKNQFMLLELKEKKDEYRK